MENKERNITPEEAIILWHASRLDLSEDYEQAPEILKVQGSVIGTLGNFSASIGKAKSKKTVNNVKYEIFRRLSAGIRQVVSHYYVFAVVYDAVTESVYAAIP